MISAGQACLNQVLRCKNLSAAEANVLLFLYMNGDGTSQERVVTATQVSKAAISRTVSSLEAKGFVLRQRDTSDRRSCRLFLTPKALEEQCFIQEQYAQIVAAAMEGIPEDKISEFTFLLATVAENIEKYSSFTRSVAPRAR